jgi:glycerol-3-phosphate acyltransferase PlsY
MTAVFLIAAFCIGSFPTAYVVANRLRGIDIRRHGSGNVGATNVFRVLGKGPGSLVFLIDAFKGFLPVMAYKILVPEASPVMPLLVGLTAILGHMLTPFLGFRGGKGVATGAGVLAAFQPLLFATTFFVWILSFSITRIVSLSSVLAAAALLAASVFLHEKPDVIAVFGLFFILALWGHRANIARLFQGTEKRF